MIRILTVYSKDLTPNFKPYTMDRIRWLRISEALARLGYKVDMIVNNGKNVVQKNKNLRYISPKRVRWEKYDIIKTLFHKGFQFLLENGADNHPFIISKLGSVVGGKDDAKGVYFFNNLREELYQVQKKIAQKSRYVTILTEQSKHLWKKEFGTEDNILLVPTGVDRDVPPPYKNPYNAFKEKIAVYLGNLYSRFSQKKVNLKWQLSLNILGRVLKKKGIRLCLIGIGDMDKLDKDAVTYLGAIENDKIWDYQYFANVGIVLAQGEVQHNESSKIYYYLRAGLPVVSEEPVPNNNVIREANLGFIVEYNDSKTMAERIEEAVHKKWDRQGTIEYMLKYHTWDIRVQRYYQLIEDEFSWKK